MHIFPTLCLLFSSFLYLSNWTGWPQRFPRCAGLGWRVFRLRSLEINTKRSQPAGEKEIRARCLWTENWKQLKAQDSQGCSLSFRNRFANAQTSANTNTETIKLAWWKTSTKLFTWPTERLNPASTFSFRSIKMFKGNKNQPCPSPFGREPSNFGAFGVKLQWHFCLFVFQFKPWTRFFFLFRLMKPRACVTDTDPPPTMFPWRQTQATDIWKGFFSSLLVLFKTNKSLFLVPSLLIVYLLFLFLIRHKRAEQLSMIAG